MRRLTRSDNCCLAEGEVLIQEERGGISVQPRPWDSTVQVKAVGGDPTRKNQYAYLTPEGLNALIMELQAAQELQVAQELLAKKDVGASRNPEPPIISWDCPPPDRMVYSVEPVTDGVVPKSYWASPAGIWAVRTSPTAAQLFFEVKPTDEVVQEQINRFQDKEGHLPGYGILLLGTS